MTAYTAITLETALVVMNQNSELSQLLRHAASLRVTTSTIKPMPALFVLPLVLFVLSKLYALRVSVDTFWSMEAAWILALGDTSPKILLKLAKDVLEIALPATPSATVSLVMTLIIEFYRSYNVDANHSLAILIMVLKFAQTAPLDVQFAVLCLNVQLASKGIS